MRGSEEGAKGWTSGRRGSTVTTIVRWFYGPGFPPPPTIGRTSTKFLFDMQHHKNWQIPLFVLMCSMILFCDLFLSNLNGDELEWIWMLAGLNYTIQRIAITQLVFIHFTAALFRVRFVKRTNKSEEDYHVSRVGYKLTTFGTWDRPKVYGAHFCC